jgi:hypothetical protein
MNILNKRIYTRSALDIILNQGYIRNAFMNELYAITQKMMEELI